MLVFFFLGFLCQLLQPECSLSFQHQINQQECFCFQYLVPLLLHQNISGDPTFEMFMKRLAGIETVARGGDWNGT
jgi:hypothetical protein